MISFSEKIKAFKESLSIAEVMEVVKHLGAERIIKVDNSSFRCRTICHGGDSDKLYYYHDTGTFNCYTGCDTFDILELTNKVKQFNSVGKSFGYLCNLLGIDNDKFDDIEEENTGTLSEWSFIESLYTPKIKSQTKVLPEVPSDVFNIFQNIYPQEWIEQGINISTMQLMGIQLYTQEGQIIIPHHDIDGRIVGVRIRETDKDKAKSFGKYRPYYDNRAKKDYRHPLSRNLYGLYFTKEAIKRTKKVMIVEGEKSVQQAYSYFKDDCFVVALCGNRISEWQINMLVNVLEVEEVMIGLDKPEEHKRDAWIKHIKEKIAKPLALYVRVYVLWDTKGLLQEKDSPTDRGKDVLLDLMKNKIYLSSEVL